MAVSRRNFIKNTGIGLLTFTVAGCRVPLTPQQAKQSAVEFGVLKPQHVDTLEALGETLVPGSSARGLAHFIDHQLDTDFPNQLLMIKFLGVNPPFKGFYMSGLEGLDKASQSLFGDRFASLDSEQSNTLVAQMSQNNPTDWSGPPAPFFYFVLRNDAIDVTYADETGFESLGIPYMAHIKPPKGDWIG